MPFGPVTFYIQAAFFYLFGPTFTATVLSAATLNALATACVMRIISLEFRNDFRAEAAGGLITALCFQSVFGTLWLEQTAWFFSLVSLWLCFEARESSGMRQSVYRIFSGCAIVAAVMAKQNAGALMVPIWAAVVGLTSARAAAEAAAGLLLSLAAVFGWLVKTSAASGFLYNCVEVAGIIGRQRMKLKVLANAAVLHTFPPIVEIVMWTAFATGLVCLWLAALNRSQQPTTARHLASIFVITSGLVIVQSIMLATTMNDNWNGVPYLGLVAGALFGAAAQAASQIVRGDELSITLPSLPAVTRCISALTMVVTIACSLSLIRIGLNRGVQQFAAASFNDSVDVPGMRSVRWISEGIGPTSMRRQDFEQVARILHAKTFFVMGDCTMLYGLLGAVPPQPYLYVISDHSFPAPEVRRVESQILHSLRLRNPEYIVKDSETVRAFRNMNNLCNWISEQYAVAHRVGVFEVYRRRI